ncbi:constitutive coactivator of peroxisome proliferator-activated receptor gamma-like [Cimex lectularius]|uniref:Uncharacterized protein n=1 Tax=Cimex lectularius TaxID=79782 RepID=A0A8I6SFD0_CIMLE|nr:constitutive coactivator of peroxisome proliferator-activated receptor gamma-like [Cimex lectularius]
MGIQSLETFLHNHPECYTPVNMGELAVEYKRKNKRNPVLIWHIGSCYTWLYNNKCWVLGGQLKEFAHVLESFIQKVKAAGIELIVFNGGHIQTEKLKKNISLQKERVSYLNEVFNFLWGNQQNDQVLTKYFRLLPSNINEVIVDTLSKLECKVGLP